MIEVKSSSPDATKAIAAAVASMTRSGDLIVLTGDLGAGKTAFVQGFGAALGVVERITSPTFTLVHDYQGAQLLVHHLDVYRLEDVYEVFDLSLPELLDDGSVTIIEWGDRVSSELPPNYLEVRLRLGDPARPDDRVLEFVAIGNAWVDRLAEFEVAFSSLEVPEPC
ncbi:MAG: tRNA (adenosine(37)-N6)-threonylcarbamoyltransferase complex ATPase subunit type 1 TsaE [Acidimicrobiales bacterium]|nr:tRNA (adenosine(37)-N6)-threonylcarbamoyltransferase complex ATPase subunit type 1 TsaE [Acidimicrobiales bacterium]